MTNAGEDGGTPRSGSAEARLAALEAEIVVLRGRVRRIEPPLEHSPDASANASARAQSALADRLRAAPAVIRRPSLSGDAIESWVGRYGTLVAGAFVILLGIGTLVVWAVQRGLLSPELRVAAGVATTGC